MSTGGRRGQRAPVGAVLRQRIKANRLASAALEAADVALRRARWGHLRDPRPAPLADREARSLLAQLDLHGIAIVPGYWPSERCAAARAAIDGFLVAHPERVWADATGADRRVYGLERVDAVARGFAEDATLAAVARAAWRTPIVNSFVSAGRVDGRPGNRGSGGQGWHLDGVTQQLKAVLYLSDVGPDDGPFAYVRGTVTLRERLRHIWRSGAVFRQLAFDEAAVARMEATAPGSLVTACGPAGTLVLARTFGVHRGSPVVAGPRYALTSYYFATSALADIAAYYARQVVPADGAAVSAAVLAAGFRGA